MTGYKSAFFYFTSAAADDEKRERILNVMIVWISFRFFILRSKGEGTFDSHVLIMIERWKEQ